VGEELKRLVEAHGYQAILNELQKLAASEITPLNIGYMVVYEAGSKPKSTLLPHRSQQAKGITCQTHSIS
jgi:hypothetical protein